MADFEELKQLLTHLLTNRFSPKPHYIRGLMGDGRGNVEVPDKPDKIFARFNRGSTEFFEVFNRTVNPVDGWPILIGELPWQPGLTQVVDTDWAAYEQSGWGQNLGDTSAHAPTHEWPDTSPGSDPISIYTRAIIPLRAYVAGSGTTTVFVNSYEYDPSGTVWGGVPGIDLQPIINVTTTGTMRYAGIYLDVSNNTLGVVTGNTTVHTPALEPPLVSFPAGVLPSARIRLYGSQTSVTEADIVDARRLFTPFVTGTSSGLSGVAPRPGKVNLLDSSGSVAVEYNTFTAAVAAAATGDTIWIGIGGSFTCDDETAIANVDVIGMGLELTTLTTTSETNCLNLAGFNTVENLTVNNASTSGTAYGIRVTGSGCVLRDVGGFADTTSGAGQGSRVETGDVTVYGGEFSGTDTASAGGDIIVVTGATATLHGPRLLNNVIGGDGTYTGNVVDSKGRDAGKTVTNSSGATALPGDVGYLDSSGEYQTTTTAEFFNGTMAAVAIGGPGGDKIFIRDKGNVTLNYTGSDPTTSHILTTSTTAGSVQARSGMHPAIVAIPTATGSDGEVEAVLYMNRRDVEAGSDNLMLKQFSIDSTVPSWDGTINDGAPTTSPVTVSTVTGNINTITPDSSSDEFKLVLRNTTQGNEALIDSVSGNDVTFVDDTPLSSWTNGDTVDIQSDENTTDGYATVDLSQSTSVPALATMIWLQIGFRNSNSLTASLSTWHPYETFSSTKQISIEPQNTAQQFRVPQPITLIERRFTRRLTGSGSGAIRYQARLLGYRVATP